MFKKAEQIITKFENNEDGQRGNYLHTVSIACEAAEKEHVRNTVSNPQSTLPSMNAPQ